MEVNWDCVIGKVAGDSRRGIKVGESIRKIALLRADFFEGELVTALATPVLGGAGKGDSNKREEDSESDRETKSHVRRKMTSGDNENECECCIVIGRDTQRSKECGWGQRGSNMPVFISRGSRQSARSSPLDSSEAETHTASHTLDAKCADPPSHITGIRESATRLLSGSRWSWAGVNVI